MEMFFVSVAMNSNRKPIGVQCGITDNGKTQLTCRWKNPGGHTPEELLQLDTREIVALPSMNHSMAEMLDDMAI